MSINILLSDQDFLRIWSDLDKWLEQCSAIWKWKSSTRRIHSRWALWDGPYGYSYDHILTNHFELFYFINMSLLLCGWVVPNDIGLNPAGFWNSLQLLGNFIWHWLPLNTLVYWLTRFYIAQLCISDYKVSGQKNSYFRKYRENVGLCKAFSKYHASWWK